MTLSLSLSPPLIQVIGSHIKPGTDVVHSPDFKNDIIKIQGGVEDTLTDAEKRAVKIFLIEGEQSEVVTNAFRKWTPWRARPSMFGVSMKG